ncbi:uncharacterized protein LOC110987483 isoform X2 [Acanthaster planci]|uniref:Uncharacterized protein LOC110987483 isoform X2 n=1 Tax=Acanthaster planci TaxID=133434 RepID=A0A8B7ZLK1_ACAPL|nr:uncharacterized protein LOC110987483 isoform X2 [Acanthaster planci]
MALWVILAIVYLQTSIDSIQAVCTPCPFQWTESQSNCYRYFEASLSYRDAVEYCQHFSRPARIASLATVTSFNELLFMSKFVDDIFKNAFAPDVPSLIWLTINSRNTSGMPSMDLKVYVDGELIQADDMSDAITEGGRSDDFTRLYLGMTNTCTGKYPVSQYGGSAAYSSLVVFDGLLGIQEIRHLYECRSIGKLVNIATVDHATIGPTLLATDDTEHQFNMDDENTDIFYNTPPATDGSPTTGPRLELQENPFICQL